ncbi:MAG: CPBP family intramembrane glutamic endopeptidase [Bacteroidota bacterium]
MPLTGYLIIWLAGWGGFYNTEFITSAAQSLGWSALPPAVFIVLFFIVNGVIGLFASMSTALGEEIGWRGFLVPNLFNVTGYTYTSLITGVVWAVWHYPLLIFGVYNNGASPLYGLTCFYGGSGECQFYLYMVQVKIRKLVDGSNVACQP